MSVLSNAWSYEHRTNLPYHSSLILIHLAVQVPSLLWNQQSMSRATNGIARNMHMCRSGRSVDDQAGQRSGRSVDDQAGQAQCRDVVSLVSSGVRVVSPSPTVSMDDEDGDGDDDDRSDETTTMQEGARRTVRLRLSSGGGVAGPVECGPHRRVAHLFVNGWRCRLAASGRFCDPKVRLREGTGFSGSVPACEEQGSGRDPALRVRLAAMPGPAARPKTNEEATGPEGGRAAAAKAASAGPAPAKVGPLPATAKHAEGRAPAAAVGRTTAGSLAEASGMEMPGGQLPGEDDRLPEPRPREGETLEPGMADGMPQRRHTRDR